MHVSPNADAGGDLGPIAIPSVIPLFPLPNVVFFPRTYLPLHIFEPRYRHMVRDAASSHRMIGMVLLKEVAVANAGPASPASATVVPVDLLRKFLDSQYVTPATGRIGTDAAKAAVVRVICVRK